MKKRNDEYEGPEHPGVHKLAEEIVCADGDTAAGWTRLSFRCGGCGRPHKTVAPPTSPVHAKFLCRFCNYTSTVKTRDEAFDQIEEHVEEGAFDEKIKKQHSVDFGQGVKTPWGKATLIN